MKPAVATAAVKPMTAEGKSGTPCVEGPADGERRGDRAEAHHPADREVDAGADDDEGLPEPEEQDGGDGDEDVLRVADGEEADVAAADQRHGDDEEGDHEAEEGPGPEVAEGEDEPLRRGPGRGRAGIESGHSVAFMVGMGCGGSARRALPGCGAAVSRRAPGR